VLKSLLKSKTTKTELTLKLHPNQSWKLHAKPISGSSYNVSYTKFSFFIDKDSEEAKRLDTVWKLKLSNLTQLELLCHRFRFNVETIVFWLNKLAVFAKVERLAIVGTNGKMLEMIEDNAEVSIQTVKHAHHLIDFA